MRGLGYERYGACGTDWGAAVTTYMALDDPAPLLGIHLSNLDNGPSAEPETEAERAYVAATRRWDAIERGYSFQQSTRPQTLAYGLTDSPAGAGRVDPREVARLGRHRRRPRGRLRPRLPARAGDALLGHGHDRHLTARLPRQPRAPARATLHERVTVRHRDRQLPPQLRPGGQAAARVGGADATTSSASPTCRAAATSPPPRHRSCSRPRSAPSSASGSPPATGRRRGARCPARRPGPRATRSPGRP